MEVKKSPKADLENKKLLFREIGLVAVLGIVLLAFEWSTKDKPDMMDISPTLRISLSATMRSQRLLSARPLKRKTISSL